jgi:hypothetical protein
MTYFQIVANVNECVDWKNEKPAAQKVYDQGILSRCAMVRFSQCFSFRDRALVLDFV